MMNAHRITAEFEQALCEYTGSPYAVAIDNCSNALFLALTYELNVLNKYPPCYPGDRLEITIPRHTYPSVPATILHAGGKVEFMDNDFYDALQDIDNPKGTLTGAYQLAPTDVWDCALRFTTGMYRPGQFQCLSFSGPFKTLKLGKGGAILTDNADAYAWFKKARFSGRSECSYHDDDFDVNPVIGYNFYMMPEIAARGLLLMSQFYNQDGTPKHNADLCLSYPDLSKFKLWQSK